MIMLLSGVVAASLAAVSCSDNEYDFENLFPEEYHNIVAIASDMTGEIVFRDCTDNIDFDVEVIKGGGCPDKSSEAHLEVISQDDLTSTNPNYVALPDNCYTLEGNSLVFDGTKAKKSIRVKFAMEPLRDFIAANIGKNAEFVIGLTLVSGNATVNSDKSRIVRTIVYMEPEEIN